MKTLSQILEKGTILQKPDHEILARFIAGLPDKMAFFVRAGQPSDLSSALTSAKMAETCGYRDRNPLASNPVVSGPTSGNNEVDGFKSQISALTSTVHQLVTSKHDDVSNSTTSAGTVQNQTQHQTSRDVASLTEEVSKLSKTVSELLISRPRTDTSHRHYQPQQNNFQRGQTQFQNPNSPTCFNCNFPGHKKRECNWNGQGYPSPGKCQLCRQVGHPAYRCKTQVGVQSGNAQTPGESRPSRQGYRY